MVPFIDLKLQHRNLKPEIMEAVSGVLDSAGFILGRETALFEEEFAAYCGVRYAVGVNSGTSALHLALLASGIGPGDEVVTTPMTFAATVAAILYTGATPRLVDIDPVSYTIDPFRIEAAITERTRAIMPVHLYGRCAEMDLIREIASKHGVCVIEDAAQAHGANYRGAKAGSMGFIGCFSFYPGKNLGACGEGGMAVTNDEEAARKMRMLRDWGQERKYEHVLKGYNYRLEGIQAAILRIKLRHLEAWTEARHRNARIYDRLLAHLNVGLPLFETHLRHVYHIYAVRVPNRDKVREYLEKNGIGVGIHYPYPIHLLEAYSDSGYKPGDFPNAEGLASEELSLPMYPELTEAQIEEVVSVLGEAMKKV